MRGRITSVEAVNEHGVSYRQLLEHERKLHARLEAAYRDALKAWEAADRASNNSKSRRALLRLAREKSLRALA